MSLERNKELAARYIQQTAAAKYDVSLFADDFTNQTPISGVTTLKPFIASAEGLIARFPKGYTIDIISMVAEGECVALFAKSRGELADGRVYQNDYMYYFTMANGRIKHVQVFYDTQVAYDMLSYAVRAQS